MTQRQAQIAEAPKPAVHVREFELLLCTARTVPDTARIHALVREGIHWRTFFDLASEHGLRLLVYQSLRATCWDDVPPDIQSEWQQASQILTRRNLFLTRELLRINAAFQSADIFLAFMKGPIVAEMCYGDFALREFADLDLLIREADFSRAVELLERIGYERPWKHSNSKMLSFLKNVGEYAVSSDALQTAIDLHWRVATKATALSPRLGDFPSGFHPVPIAGSSVLSFAPQDLPLYLAAQGGWDRWSDLRRICDLAEFIRAYPVIEWEPNLQAARRLGGLRSMLTGLSLASQLLGAELPETVADHIQRDPIVARLAEEAIRHLQGHASASEAISRYLFQLRAKEGRRGKIALACSILMDRTAKDATWIMLPRPLWWLYGLLRPMRMSGKFLRRL
ncbi:MAG TPA: nucleotidyltransferase family protein [Silvibacterium sp.]|nr:nucleotidyltransferase family protein [Silvibacterium sp.]